MAEYNKGKELSPPSPKGSNPYAIDEGVTMLIIHAITKPKIT